MSLRSKGNPPRPKIAAFFTGGTISMKVDPQAGGAVPALCGKEILDLIPEIASTAEVKVYDVGQWPGPHVTPQRMLELAHRVEEQLAQGGVVGAIVTHGTDTLEETAYLLSLTLQTTKPVVFVGAMRNGSQPSWDGPANLLSAVRVASEIGSQGRGVLICLNDTILPAEDGTKTHTVGLHSFQGRDGGPLGRVDDGRIQWHRNAPLPEKIQTTQISEAVEIVKLAAGSDGRLALAAADSGAEGLVIEGLGCGNVPITALPNLEKVLARGIPVIIATRCHQGPTSEAYAYPGAARTLKERGAILAGSLPSHKARMKLMVLLGAGKNLTDIRQAFER